MSQNNKGLTQLAGYINETTKYNSCLIKLYQNQLKDDKQQKVANAITRIAVYDVSCTCEYFYLIMTCII